MILFGRLLPALFGSVIAFGLFKFFQYVYHQLTSPIRNLRGPNGTSWIYGNLRDIWNAENSVLHEGWVREYGSTLKYKGFFYSNRLFTMDTRAINHVLTHANDYQKSSQVRHSLSGLFGEGLLFVEGAQHRQQRRIMLRDILLSEIAKDPAGTTSGSRLDVMPWLNRTTLDVIGLAGFNYRFDSLNASQKPNELNEAFAILFAGGQGLSILPILQAWFPPLRLLPTERARKTAVARHTMARIGKELLSDVKASVRATATAKDEIEKDSLRSRDLLSLLVKANMATDIPENQRLSDEDVLAQVPTFLVAGHETTSAATAWALYAMAKAPEIQAKLREEVFSVDMETLSMDELMALPYLEAVVRETLRVHAPVPATQRIAMKDDVLPVEKPYTDKNGVMHDSISVREGDSIFISIVAINRSQELWGPDAHDFKPERWTNVPEAASHIPGIWGHMLTFLGGPRACIGFKFSLVEMKALLFILVRTFEFELAVPASEIGKRSMVVQRPILLGDPNRKPQLPLIVKPYKQTN